MKQHIDNSGPAFPTVHGRANGDGTFAQNQIEEGMTLRDYFAGQALIACRNHSNEQWVAERSYKIADAMLKARSL